MRTRFITMLMTVASLLVGAQALAQPQLPNFQPGDVLRANDLNLIVERLKAHTNALSASSGETRMVDCDAGETIMAAMDQAQPGDTIMVAGTCNENVVVDKDGITLAGEGQDSTVINGDNIDASVIAVLGHQNVTIKDLTVQNGLVGIHLGRGAAAWLENVTAKDSRSKDGHASGFGILIANSSDAILTGSVVVSNNADNGIQVWNGSSVAIAGNYIVEGSPLPRARLETSGNGGSGMEVGLGSALHVASLDGDYTTVRANNNRSIGIDITGGSSAQFGGGADIEASGNEINGLEVAGGSSVNFQIYPARGVKGKFNDNRGWAGIAVESNSSVRMWYWNDAAGAKITAENNAGLGLGVAQNSSATFDTGLSQFASSNNLVFSNNGNLGVGVYSGSTAIVRLPTEIKNNANSGIEMWGNAFVDLGSVSKAAVVIASNGGNGIVSYNGSDLNLDSATIESNTGNGVAIYDNANLYSNGTTITGNGGDGINAWGGVGIGLDDTSVTGNTRRDISAGGGSRLHGYNGSQVVDVDCDDSVLSYGDVSCPDNQQLMLSPEGNASRLRR